ncbi:MAG: hypothetical protein SF028_04540 [Candidatus Sumerlaeia bacterium]|nr:hypothetical protein [Candidatus Sumerlaeia bacterium]
MATQTYVPLTDTLFLVPFVRGRFAFVNAVRRAFHELRPDTVAAELPRAITPRCFELLEHLPELMMLAYRDGAGRGWFVANDPADAAVEACRLALDYAVDSELLDVPQGASGSPHPPLPDGDAAPALGFAEYASRCLDAFADIAPDERMLTIARRVRLIEERSPRTLLVVSFPVAAALRRLWREGIPPGKLASDDDVSECELLPIPESKSGHASIELPYLLYRYERFRHDSPGLATPFERGSAMGAMLRHAGRRYARRVKRRVSPTEWKALRQYARNLALVRGRMLPDFSDLVQAAKACVDDEYGALLFDLATRYPPNTGAAPEEPAEASEDAAPGAEETRTLRHESLSLYAEFPEGTTRIEPAYPSGDLRELVFSFRRKPTAAQAAAYWEKLRKSGGFRSSTICSWPPEDIRLEAFLRYVRQRALEKLSEGQRRVEEFSTSFLDGLDTRETIRRAHEGKLFVRRDLSPRGRIGPVVILWHDTPMRTGGLWRATLYAENQNESDIAVVCAPTPGKDAVGPGISRSRYDALLSVYPACGIPDIWSEPAFVVPWRTHGRALVAAAILLSRQRHVAVVSAAPIDADLRELARHVGVGVIHMPLSSFSSALLDRVRTVHILADREARGWGHHYIPK